MRRNLIVAGLLAVLLAAAQASGQSPPPPCAPGTALVPDFFNFVGDDGDTPITTLTVGHAGGVRFNIRDAGGWIPSASSISGPSGLAVKAVNNDTDASATFTPATPGPLTFTATWTQKSAQQPDSVGCTGSVTATLTTTAPTPVRVLKGLGYGAGDGHFQITADVVASRLHGDRSPIRMTVRVVKRQHRPPASAPAATLTLDPNGPTRGVTGRTRLLLLHAYPVDAGNEPQAEYIFQTRVQAPIAGGKVARRGVEIKLFQGSRLLRTITWATRCDGLHGGVFCYPGLKDSLN